MVSALSSSTQLPAPVALLLAWYLPRVQEILGENLQTITLFGSVALDDFAPGWSDVDFCTTVHTPFDQSIATRLGELHDHMRDTFIHGHAPAWRSQQVAEGFYLPQRLAMNPDVVDDCFTAFGHTRRFARSNPPSPFDRYQLAHHALSFYGPAVDFAPPEKATLQLQLATDLHALTTPPPGGMDSALWLAGMVHWVARSVIFWRDGRLVGKTYAMQNEIATHHPLADYYVLPLEVRLNGAAGAGNHLAALRANFQSLVPQALAFLSPYAKETFSPGVQTKGTTE